jgi:hypothetical protein
VERERERERELNFMGRNSKEANLFVLFILS